MQDVESTRTVNPGGANESATHQVRIAPAPSRRAESLLERLKRREPAAQEKLYRERRRPLEALASSVLDCSADAGSLVADVFTDFFFHYVDTIRDEAAISAYLRMMTLRRARRQNELHNRQEDVADHESIVAGVHDAAEKVDTNIWASWLDDCLGRLSQKSRRLLRLHYGHDLSMGEIGAQLGVSKQAVSKAIQKSVGLLRHCLENKRTRKPQSEAP